MDDAATSTYDVVLVGLDGGSVERVAATLQALLTSSDDDARACVRQVLAGERVTVARGLSDADATRFTFAFTEAGALVERLRCCSDPCDVVLLNVGADRLRVLKILCEALPVLLSSPSQGHLARVSELAAQPPAVLQRGLRRAEADRLVRQLQEAGADARVTPPGEGASEAG